MRRAPIEKIKLSDNEKKKITEEIIRFYRDVCDEEIGVIKQQQLLELFLDELAPVVYNKALDDAKRWYADQQSNMESDFYMLYKDK